MRHISLWLFIFFVSVYLLTAGGHTYAADDESIVHVLDAFFSRGGFDLPAPETAVTVGTFRASDGRYYAQSGIAQPVIAAPFYIVGRLLAQAFEARYSDFFARLVLGFFNAFVSAAIAVLLYAFGRALGYSARIALALALAWGLTTNAWAEAKSFYNEPLMALLLLLAFYCIHFARARRQLGWYALAGLAWGASLATKLHAVLALPALLLYASWQWQAGAPRRSLWREIFDRTSPKRIFFFGIGACLSAGAGVLFYNFIRFGNPFETGYGGELDPIPIWNGLYGILLSPGKSIFLFAPVAMLGLFALPRFWRVHRTEGFVFAFYLVTAIFFHANFSDWHSRGAWGNRYMYLTLPYWILPIGALLMLPRARVARAAFGALFAAGLVIQLLVAPINFDTYLNINRNEMRRIFDLASSPVLAHAGLLNERAEAWWNQIFSKQAGIILEEGWLAPHGEAGEFLPRYIAPRATFSIQSNPSAPIHVSVAVQDFRAANLPRRELQILRAGNPIAAGVMQNPENAELRYTFTIPAPHPERVTIELRTIGSQASGSSPMGDELGFNVNALVVETAGAPLDFYPDLSIVPLPVRDSRQMFGWFYEPALPQWDVWWWYIYHTGITRSAIDRFAIPFGFLLVTMFIYSSIMLGYLWRHSANPSNRIQ